MMGPAMSPPSGFVAPVRNRLPLLPLQVLSVPLRRGLADQDRQQIMHIHSVTDPQRSSSYATMYLRTEHACDRVLRDAHEA